jgi:hypothetical protein
MHGTRVGDTSTKQGGAPPRLARVPPSLRATGPSFIHAPMNIDPWIHEPSWIGERDVMGAGMKLPRARLSLVDAPPSFIGESMMAHGWASDTRRRAGGGSAPSCGPTKAAPCASPHETPADVSSRQARSPRTPSIRDHATLRLRLQGGKSTLQPCPLRLLLAPLRPPLALLLRRAPPRRSRRSRCRPSHWSRCSIPRPKSCRRRPPRRSRLDQNLSQSSRRRSRSPPRQAPKRQCPSRPRPHRALLRRGREAKA